MLGLELVGAEQQALQRLHPSTSWGHTVKVWISACNRSTCTSSTPASLPKMARNWSRLPLALSYLAIMYSASVGSLTPRVASSSAHDGQWARIQLEHRTQEMSCSSSFLTGVCELVVHVDHSLWCAQAVLGPRAPGTSREYPSARCVAATHA